MSDGNPSAEQELLGLMRIWLLLVVVLCKRAFYARVVFKSRGPRSHDQTFLKLIGHMSFISIHYLSNGG